MPPLPLPLSRARSKPGRARLPPSACVDRSLFFAWIALFWRIEHWDREGIPVGVGLFINFAWIIGARLAMTRLAQTFWWKGAPF